MKNTWCLVLLAISCATACTSVPADTGPNTLSADRASLAGPSQCKPAPTPQGGVGCEWRNPNNNRMFLTLDEQAVAFPAEESVPNARLIAAVKAFGGRLATYPGFEGLYLVPGIDLRGENIACADYSYSQTIRNEPGLQGHIVKSLGFGKLCVDNAGPPDRALVVIAEVNETWFPSMGRSESENGLQDAQMILESLSIR